MTRKTILLLYLLCGVTGGLLALIQNHADSSTALEKYHPGAAKSKSRSSAGGAKGSKSVGSSFGDKWSRLLEEGRMIGNVDEPHSLYPLHGNHGEVSDDGIAAAGLTGDQAREVKAALEAARDEMFRLFADAVELDKRKPKDKADEVWYRIPNQLEPGAKILEDLQKKFGESCGKEKAGELVRALNPIQHYANFGRQDISLRWSRVEVDGKEQWRGEAHCFDGPTGQKTTEMLIPTREALRSRFGDGVPWPAD